MISALIEDRDRNQLIAHDVAQEYHANGNYCLILSDRKAHCEALASLLERQGIKCAVLTGDISKKERESIVQKFDDGSLRVVLATGQLAGEGLDIPKLNRLFITTPIRWKGRVKQYVGRALRTAAGKDDAKIYDYVDSNIGVLVSAYKSRCYSVYNQLN